MHFSPRSWIFLSNPLFSIFASDSSFRRGFYSLGLLVPFCAITIVLHSILPPPRTARLSYPCQTCREIPHPSRSNLLFLFLGCSRFPNYPSALFLFLGLRLLVPRAPNPTKHATFVTFSKSGFFYDSGSPRISRLARPHPFLVEGGLHQSAPSSKAHARLISSWCRTPPSLPGPVSKNSIFEANTCPPLLSLHNCRRI